MHVQNHQIAGDSLEPPVVVRPEQLPNTRHSDRAFYRSEKYRPVARDAEAPERLLSEFVVLDGTLRRSESRVREHQMTGEILIQRRVSRRDSKVPQLRLCLRPRQIEGAPRAVRIMIQIGQLNRAFFLFGDERRERYVGRSAGWDAHLHTQ